MSPIIPSRKAFHQRLPSDDELQKKQDGDPAGSSTELLSPARWKGKGKATEQDLDPGSDIGDHEHERVPGQSDSSEQLDGPGADAVGASYPPTTEDEEESKRIQENLRRWEEAERQKRRAARESRLITAPNRTSVVEDAARGLTRLLSRSGPRRESVHNPHRPLRPTSGDAEDGYALHRPESPSTPRPMTPGLSPASTAHPSPPAQSLAAAASPFSDAHAATADPAGPLMEPVSNPASVPPTPDEHPQHPSRPVLPVQQSHLDVPSSRSDPMGRTPPPRIVIPGEQPQASSSRAQQLEHHSPEDPPSSWWTEWLCGCREDKRESQGGATNPFE